VQNLLAMVTAVGLKPDDETAVRALIDCAEEEHELEHGAAVRYAVGVRRQARYDALAAQVAPLLKPPSPHFIDLREQCREQLSLPLNAYLTLSQHRRGDRVKLLEVHRLSEADSGYAAAYTVSIRTDYAIVLRDTLDQLRRKEAEENMPPAPHRRRRRGGQHDPAGA
jgi:hypothetical protein